MTQFKSGDRVEYTGNINSKIVGYTGTVITQLDDLNVKVEWDDPINGFGTNRVNLVYPESLTKKDITMKSDEYETILDEAKRLVYGNRNADYGHPADDYKRTAALWSAILNTEVTPQQAILCMIAVKVSRLCNDHNKRDSIVDIGGYAECLMRVNRREEGLE